MNKLFKLIIVNILGLFDVNKIIIARQDGIKSNLEKKLILTGIIAIVYTYLIYRLFNFIDIEDSYLILALGFIVSSFLCFFMDLFIIDPIIFKNPDNEMLFSLPVTRQQILFSKLFIIYLRNLVYVGIIMISCFISFNKVISNINDGFGLIFIISSLFIPLLPIILASVISYFNDYIKIISNNSLKYRIGKVILILIVFIIFILIFNGINSSNINTIMVDLINRFYYIYPLSYLFIYSLKNESYVTFVALIGILICLSYLYNLFLSKKYQKICSLLKGIHKKEVFKYPKTKALKKIGGLIRKEFKQLFNNKFYLFNSYSAMIFFSFLLLIILNIYDFNSLYNIENFDIYINLFLPTFLSLFVTIRGSAISAMSLEKKNMQILRTMPIKMNKILFSKILVNIIIGSIFVIINGSLVWYYLDLDKVSIIYCYLLPFISLCLITLTSIILDYRFIEKKEDNDNAIIKQRIIVMVPSFLAIIISFGPLFIPVYRQYKLLLGSYVLAMLIIIFIEFMYLVICKKKLLQNLFN